MMSPQEPLQGQGASYSGGQREFDPGAYERYFAGGKAKPFVMAFLKSSEKFLSTIDVRIQSLKEAIASNEPSQVAHAGHSLKGSFRTLGANQLADIAETLEKDFKVMSTEAVNEKFQEALERLTIYKAELAQFAKYVKSTNTMYE